MCNAIANLDQSLEGLPVDITLQPWNATPIDLSHMSDTSLLNLQCRLDDFSSVFWLKFY